METIAELIARRPHVEFAVELPERTVAEFGERGFTSIERVTTDEELAWLSEFYDRLFADRANTVPGAYIDDVLRPYDKP
ncbi:MAG: hypothetical protein ACREQF_08040, partial [Candidatus Binataceae bacterium]